MRPDTTMPLEREGHLMVTDHAYPFEEDLATEGRVYKTEI